MKQTRIDMSRTSVALFGEKRVSDLIPYLFGTGTLVDLRGTPITLTPVPTWSIRSRILSSWHTVAESGTHARSTVTDSPILPWTGYAWRSLIPRCFRGSASIFRFPAANASLHSDRACAAALAYGFPTGRPDVQVGGVIDEINRQAYFKSMTYLDADWRVRVSITRLGRTQPRIEMGADKKR